MQLDLDFEVAALFLVTAVMLHFFLKKNIATFQTKTFSALVLMAFAATALDIVSICMDPYTKYLPLWFCYGVNQLYLITFNSTAMIYYCYIIYTVKERTHIGIVEKCIAYVPITVDVLLILSTPFTGWIFYYENSVYTHGDGFLILYFSAIFYVFTCLVQSFRYRRQLTVPQRAAVYFFTISSLIAVVIQMFYPKHIVAGFAVAISVLLIFLALENPSDFYDKQLGIYNREAFIRIVNFNMEQKKCFRILGIQIDGFKYINETLGVNNGDNLLKEIVQFLITATKKGRVFHVTGLRFAILLMDGWEDMTELTKRITERFWEPFITKGVEVSLTAPMCCLTYPDNVKSLEDVMDTIEYSLKESRNSSNECVVYASDEILKKKRRETQVLQAVKQALRNHKFEVYYQPIYSVEKERYTSAEALIRLKDDKLGFISPEEFIPLSEKNGIILDIGEYVFHSVCSFIMQEKLWEKGIEYIEVNLSVVQCMQEKMYESLLAIMKEHGVESSMLNLEITETSAIISSEILMNNMRHLIQHGSTFSLDDYGTGYSNTTNLIDFPFQIIKLDKSMIWGAMDNEKALVALKHTTAMIKEMR